jgi:hypothetical protein
VKSIKSKALTLVCLMATGNLLSGCGAGMAIPESLKAPCVSTVDVSAAETVGDLGRAIVAQDGDLALCSLKKEAVVEIAEAGNRRWYEFWR